MAESDHLYKAVDALERVRAHVAAFTRYRAVETGPPDTQKYTLSNWLGNGADAELTRDFRDLSVVAQVSERRIAGVWIQLSADQKAERRRNFILEDPFNRDLLQAGQKLLNASILDVAKAFARKTKFLAEYHDPPKAPLSPFNMTGDDISMVSMHTVADNPSGSDILFAEHGPGDLATRFYRRQSYMLTTWLEATSEFFDVSENFIRWAERELQTSQNTQGVSTMITVHIGDGNTFNAPVAIADTIQNSLNAVGSSDLSGEIKTALQDVLKAIGEASNGLPGDKLEQAEDMAVDGATLAQELDRAKPRKEEVQRKITGIAKTAEALGKAAVPILDAIGKLKPLLPF